MSKKYLKTCSTSFSTIFLQTDGWYKEVTVMPARVWRKQSTYALLVGVHRLIQPQWKSVPRILKGLKKRSTALIGIYPKYAISFYRDTCSVMFITTLCRIAGRWEQPGCLSADKWIMKNAVYLHNGLLPRCKGKNIIFTGKWMELRITINEIMQSQRDMLSVLSHV